MVAPLLPPASSLCVLTPAAPGELCVQFPGGARVCATSGFGGGDLSEIVNSLLGNGTAGLAPLQPLLDLADVGVKMLKVAEAVPKSILSLNPQPVVEATVELALAVDKVISELVPPLPIIVLVRDLLVAVITGLQAYRAKVSALSAKSGRIAAATARAQDPALPAAVRASLLDVVGCAEANLAVELANLNAGMAPINRIITLVNTLLHLAKLPCVQTAPSAGEASEDALAPLDAALDVMQAVVAAIPVGSNAALPPLPLPTDPC